MADLEHLEILKQGVKKWNRWRKDDSGVIPDLIEAKLNGANLSRANLSWAILSGAYLGEADLSGADLNGATLSRANLREAKLWKAKLWKANLSRAKLNGAKLSGAYLSRAILHGADLHGVDLSGADLSWADLHGADLSGANLSGVPLFEADLREANLTEANLTGADLRGANLGEAKCHKANLSKARLDVARLLKTRLDGATLTGACLWETQRAGWSIKDVTCKYVYWDEEGKEKTKYSPGEFERLFADRTIVRLFYKDGINPIEIATLPALIKSLEKSHPGSGLRLVSIHKDSGGVVVELTIEDDDKSPEQLKQLKAEIETTAQRAIEYERKFLAEEKQRLQLEGALRQSDAIIEKLILRPSIKIQGDYKNMGDEYNISGQAGAVGQNASASNMTFNQIVNHFEKSFDLRALANQLGELREEMAKRQDSSPQAAIAQGEAAKAEMAAKEGNTSKVVEYLKAGGQGLLDIAKETGKELLTAAIKASMGMP